MSRADRIRLYIAKKMRSPPLPWTQKKVKLDAYEGVVDDAQEVG